MGFFEKILGKKQAPLPAQEIIPPPAGNSLSRQERGVEKTHSSSQPSVDEEIARAESNSKEGKVIYLSGEAATEAGRREAERKVDEELARIDADFKAGHAIAPSKEAMKKMMERAAKGDAEKLKEIRKNFKQSDKR